MGQWAFINNDFIKEEDARLHFRDLSIQRGYGVFDFFKVVNSVPVFLEEHLNRFYFSAEEMRLTVGYSKDELIKILDLLIKKNSVATTGVRITLTGGYSADGYQLSNPNLIIALSPLPLPSSQQFEKGIKLVTYQHQRQLPHVKSIDYLMAIWLQPFIRQNNADDVLYHKNGIVSECPRSNFFLVTKEQTLVTPSENILKGVMRSKIIEVARSKFRVEERDVSVDEIKTAKEAFITSTTKTVLPVNQIDDYLFPSLRPLTATIHKMMLELQSNSLNPKN